LGVVPAQLLNNVLEAIHAADARRVLELLGQLATEGYELTHFCAELTRTVRNLMVAKSCGADSPLVQVASQERARLAELAKLFSEEDLARFFNLLLRVESEMRYSLQPRFHLELGLMKLVYARRLTSLEGLLAQLGQSGGAEKTPTEAHRSLSAVSTSSVKLTAQGVEAPHGSIETDSAPAPSTPASPPSETRETTRVAPAVVAAPGEDAQLSSIKAALFDQSKRFLSSCLDHLAGFHVGNGEAHFTFDHKDSLYADLLKAREQQEALRAVCAQVLGQSVRIYVTLEEQRAEAQVPRLSARERAQRDPGVEAFRNKFDAVLEDVQDLSQE